MPDTVIKVENLSKHYRLGVIGTGTLSRDLQSWWARFRGKEDPNRKLVQWDAAQMGEDDSFWALKNVSFEVKQGEVLGIIGRNGAGKSTLLKILSRVTGPTTGSVKIKGRVASLLEVGTGFHPELTGRENVYLNGTILGMRKQEIDRKFDEIVEFSEVEEFLDTPVKRYSSGMYVRLAFAVAAHLEPEILIVDEVLAVGDAQFQKKCLGKMGDVSREGRTVLFVSHNINAIEQLCSSAMLLEKGALKSYASDPNSIIKEYLVPGLAEYSPNWLNTEDQYKNLWAKPIRFRIVDEKDNTVILPTSNNQKMWVEVEVEVYNPNPGLQIGYALYCENGSLLYWSCNKDIPETQWSSLDKGINIFRSPIPNRLLNEGQYRLELILCLFASQWFCRPDAFSPAIVLDIRGGLSDSPYWTAKRPGIIAPELNWEWGKSRAKRD